MECDFGWFGLGLEIFNITDKYTHPLPLSNVPGVQTMSKQWAHREYISSLFSLLELVNNWSYLVELNWIGLIF